MIRRIRAGGYKSFVNLDVSLEPLTVVFGPNAAGKSNLLDLISLVAAMGTEQSLDDAFAVHRGTPFEAFTFGDGGLEALVVGGDEAKFKVSVDIELSDAVVEAVEDEVRKAREGLPDEGNGVRPRRIVLERRLRYSLTVAIRTSSGHLRVMDEKVEALQAGGKPKQSRKPFLEADPTTWKLQLRMERQGHPIYEPFGQPRTILSKALYAPHYPHITALREELSRWRMYFLEPSAMREEAPIKETEVMAANGSDIAAFYNTLLVENPLQFDAAKKALRLLIPAVDDIAVERTPTGFLRLIVREAGMPLSSRIISEGTLRVLGLLALTSPRKPLSLIGFEEPENGIHPRRLMTVARILSGAADRGPAQVIVNTHSPNLPTLFEQSDSDEVALLACRKSGRETTFERIPARPTLFLSKDVEAALDDEPTTLGQRIVRGDFGG